MLNIAGISLVEIPTRGDFRQHQLEMQQEELAAAPATFPCCWTAKLFAFLEQEVEFLEIGILITIR